MAVTYYKTNHYVGLSTDVKPTTGVRIGSDFYETDSLASYLYSGSAWVLTSTGPLLSSKILTFTGAANLGAVGAVPLFTVTGEVVIEKIVPFCTTLLTEAAPTATLALGITGSTGLFIAATTGTVIDADEFWVDTTSRPNGFALPAALMNIVITDNIIGTVASQAVSTGVIRFDVLWRPLTGGSLVAA